VTFAVRGTDTRRAPMRFADAFQFSISFAHAYNAPHIAEG